jgi:hypothetical protein
MSWREAEDLFDRLHERWGGRRLSRVRRQRCRDASHRQQKKFAQGHQPQPQAVMMAPPGAGHGENDMVGQLQQLADLRATGAQFKAAKTKLLLG